MIGPEACHERIRLGEQFNSLNSFIISVSLFFIEFLCKSNSKLRSRQARPPEHVATEI
ncbi:unnamed protein product [Schistosoma curassoni]|uniref:Uncharacterized protein n=1 Tax=Schistosoma curassoni TaxID=6186 RepID=A0A183KDL2_9TREM|nr:unnamed protein product [Schistosoma curassoni]